MTKHLRFLFALVAVVATLSSCKKTDNSDVSILTSKKWSISSSTETYSDSVGVSHNQLGGNCPQTGYVEFANYSSSSPTIRLAHNYNTTTCPGYSLPTIYVSAWDIDRDNANLYLNGDPTTGLNGTWYTITTLNSSTLSLKYVYQSMIGYNTTPPYSPIYHTVTDAETFTAQ